MAPTKVKRSTKFNPVQTFREHLVLKSEAAKITKRSDALKKRIKEWLPSADDAYHNEQGSVFVDLPETLEVDGTAYKGMELRRAVSVRFNEETCEEILTKKSKRDKTILQDAQTPVIDQDKVHRLVAEGRITEEELDEMFEENESFSFWPVKGEVL